MRFIRTDSQMMKLHLRLRPGQSESALKCARIAVFIRKIDHLFAGRGDDGGKNNARRGAGRYANCAPQTHGRVKHRTGGVGERAAINDRDWSANVVPAPEKSG